MKLFELQDNDKEARKLWTERLSKGWKNIKEVLNYQSFQYVFEIIASELINKHYHDLLAKYFGIKKT